MITSEPLVEAIVSKFRDRAISFIFAVLFPAAWRSPGFGEEPSKSQKQNLQPWNEAQLNFVSLRSSLHYVGLAGLSRVEMNAQKTGALDSPPNPKGEVCLIFRLTWPTTS
jgi:hypothetical protein